MGHIHGRSLDLSDDEHGCACVGCIQNLKIHANTNTCHVVLCLLSHMCLILPISPGNHRCCFAFVKKTFLFRIAGYPLKDMLSPLLWCGECFRLQHFESNFKFFP